MSITRSRHRSRGLTLYPSQSEFPAAPTRRCSWSDAYFQVERSLLVRAGTAGNGTGPPKAADPFVPYLRRAGAKVGFRACPAGAVIHRHRPQGADNGHSSSSEQPAGVHHPEQTSIAWSDPSSVSIRIPRSPYAALFLFTARQRSDVLTQEWRAAATAAPFVELSRQSRDRPQARRSCARVSASSNPPPGILTGLVDSCSMPGPSSEIAAIR